MSSIEEAYNRIDEVVNIDLLGRPGTRQLYQEAKRLGEGSMCLSAAKNLRSSVHTGSIVIICTGACLPWNVTETDGPIGAAALARSLANAFGAKPIIVTQEELTGTVSVTCNAMELNVVNSVDQLRRWPYAVAVHRFPVTDEEAKKESVKLVDELAPAAIISVEALGANSRGVYHTMRGMPIGLPEYRVPKFDYLVAEARPRQILTIGIGDGGNEIGMGNIKDAVKKIHPFGERCQCPCEAGIAPDGLVDSLIVASVSNWGAYGLSASLALLLNKPDALHSASLEARAIERCVQAGGLDPIRGSPALSVDGMPIDIHTGMVNMLQVITRESPFESLRGPLFKNP